MEEKILQFILRTSLGGKGPLGHDDSLFTSGIADSLALYRIVSFLEREFGVSLALHEVTTENFDSVSRIASLVKAKQRSP